MKLSMEWVDRIFQRLEEAYGDGFTRQFKSVMALNFERSRWSAGLYGCTGEEIGKVLGMCRLKLIKSPPNVIEFYHYCKGFKVPASAKPAQGETPKSELGSEYLKLIRDKLHGRTSGEWEAAVSALDQQLLEKRRKEGEKHWQDK